GGDVLARLGGDHRLPAAAAGRRTGAGSRRRAAGVGHQRAARVRGDELPRSGHSFPAGRPDRSDVLLPEDVALDQASGKWAGAVNGRGVLAPGPAATAVPPQLPPAEAGGDLGGSARWGAASVLFAVPGNPAIAINTVSPPRPSPLFGLLAAGVREDVEVVPGV